MMAIVNLTKRVDALEVELKALKEGPAAKPKEGK
jgi:hypothetical protein